MLNCVFLFYRSYHFIVLIVSLRVHSKEINYVPIIQK